MVYNKKKKDYAIGLKDDDQTGKSSSQAKFIKYLDQCLVAVIKILDCHMWDSLDEVCLESRLRQGKVFRKLTLFGISRNRYNLTNRSTRSSLLLINFRWVAGMILGNPVRARETGTDIDFGGVGFGRRWFTKYWRFSKAFSFRKNGEGRRPKAWFIC